MHTFSPCSYGQFPKAFVQHLYAFILAHTRIPLRELGYCFGCGCDSTDGVTFASATCFFSHSVFCSQDPSPSVQQLGRIYLFLV